MYLAWVLIDTITFFNHFNFLVFYNVLQKKFKDMTISIILWIKNQGSNCELIDFWDNFKFRENIYRERTKDKIKF